MNNSSRYQRQMILPGIGEDGQLRLAQTRVTVAGAGGLGCPALLYLAAAGVGNITIIDHDVVEISNLNRQILFGPEDIGKPKAMAAAERLQRQFPEIVFTPKQVHLDNRNALPLLKDADFVADCTDRFESRYLISDACGILGIPLVFGAALGFDGQMAVFHWPDLSGTTVSYRDLQPVPPSPENAASCADAGILGAVTGTIGSMMAAAAIRILAGMPPADAHWLQWYSADGHSDKFRITPSGGSAAPDNAEAFQSFNYPLFCNMPETNDTLSKEQFAEKAADCTVIDIRETWETPELSGYSHLRIPMGELREQLDQIPAGKTVILVCEGGKRSAAACLFLRKHMPGTEILSLEGGIKNLYGID